MIRYFEVIYFYTFINKSNSKFFEKKSEQCFLVSNVKIHRKYMERSNFCLS